MLVLYCLYNLADYKKYSLFKTQPELTLLTSASASSCSPLAHSCIAADYLPRIASSIYQLRMTDERREFHGNSIIDGVDFYRFNPGRIAVIDLLDSEVTFFKWGAILIIANLTSADLNDKFEKILDKYFAPITGHVMIPAANIIASAAKIALAKPELTDRITREILKVEHAVYQTDECRNVAIGHAIKSFHQFFDRVKDQEPVIEFIKRQLDNSRCGTGKSAEKFFRKYVG